MMKSRKRTWVLVAALLSVLTGAVVHACPFCSTVSQTFSEEIAAMDAVVVVSVVSAPDQTDETAIPKAVFEIQEVIKGEKWVTVGEKVEATYYGDGSKDRTYLLMGADAPRVAWSSPLEISTRGREYILKLPSLPQDAKRLEFFQEHLEDEDEMLSRDAYDEFAKTPYAGVIALKDKMYRDKILAWIQDSEIPATRRRLYFTMLGICGQPGDTDLLEKMMKSGDRKQKAGLDAMLACYLQLKGPSGLATVEELFLGNEKSEYADTYAAIMAIRFHGTEVDKIDRKRLVKSLRLILDRPNLADLVIPDLARWEDWEVMPQLVQLFKDADEKSTWVRVPVVNYLRSCPKPEAQTYIDELSEIDPDAVKRAMTFFPFKKDEKGSNSNDNSDPKKPEAATTKAGPGENDNVLRQPVAPPNIDEFEIAPNTDGSTAATLLVSNQNETINSNQPADNLHSNSPPVVELAAAEQESDSPLSPTTTENQPSKSQESRFNDRRTANLATPIVATQVTADTPNLVMIFGVLMVAGASLFIVLRLILGMPIFGISRA